MVLVPSQQSRPSKTSSTDGFGCALKQLSVNQRLTGTDIDIFRKATVNTKLDQVLTPASDRGFVVGVSALGRHTRRIFHAHHATTHDFTDSSIYIRDQSEPYKADLGGPFDFMLFEISPESLSKIADDAEMPGVTSLSAETASRDIVLANLARALLPALEKPDEANALFVDQMTTAIGTYLIQRYGGKSEATSIRVRSLSRAQENLAKSAARKPRWQCVDFRGRAGLQPFPRLFYSRFPGDDRHDTVSMGSSRAHRTCPSPPATLGYVTCRSGHFLRLRGSKPFHACLRKYCRHHTWHLAAQRLAETGR